MAQLSEQAQEELKTLFTKLANETGCELAVNWTYSQMLAIIQKGLQEGGNGKSNAKVEDVQEQ